MSVMIRESHSIVPPDPQLDMVEKTLLVVLGVGVAIFISSIFRVLLDTGYNAVAFYVMYSCVFVGGFGYGIYKHLKHKPGIQNHHLTRRSLTSRGMWGWLLGVVITALYTLYYFFEQEAVGATRLFDPLSQLIRGRGADVWFMYGAVYTTAVLIMGVKAIVKYRHSRYQMIRTGSIIACQLVLAFLVPYWMEALNKPYFAPNYFWPLEYKSLMPDKIEDLKAAGVAGKFIIGWGLVMFLVATPILTYFYGKRWYCSWVCGCGGLANTAGDSWRQLSDKSSRAWKIERFTIYSVLVFVVVMTALVWANAAFGILPEFSQGVKKVYGYVIGAAFSGVIGVGFYPLMGTRVWCRFGCPMAAILGLIQRFQSRFRITTNGAQCISCGNCSKYCEMGIDVRWYAQRGQDVKRASCVGCGVCSAVCPRGVLSLENGPTSERAEYKMDLLASVKSRQLENKNK